MSMVRLAALFIFCLSVSGGIITTTLDNFSVQVQQYIVAAGDINGGSYNAAVATYGGVAHLSLVRSDGTFGCSGSLMTSGAILTAAHCVTGSNGALTLKGGTAKLTGADGTVHLVPISGTSVHPLWNGDFLQGNDVAIIQLGGPIAANVPRYNLYSGPLSVADAFDVAGWGMRGSFGAGTSQGSGVLRHGANQFEIAIASGSVLLSDFDNGTVARDAFGAFFGQTGLGLGSSEVSTAPGDSGGPAFRAGAIAGITSFGVRLVDPGTGFTTDSDAILNSSFGEANGFTNVGYYADWITGSHSYTFIPEPGTWAMAAGGLALLVGARLRR